MVLIIDNKEGKHYSGVCNAEERKNAQELFGKWEKIIPKIERELIQKFSIPKDPKKRTKNANEWRWELGNSLGKIIDENKVIKESEKHKIVWDAIRLHLSDRFKKTNRDNNHRDNLKNCYRLSKLPKEKVLKITWRCWSDWLDRRSLHSFRADKWMNRNIDKITSLNSDQFRAMTKFFHNNVTKKGKIVFEIYKDEEFNSLWDDKLNEFITTLESED